MAACLINNDYWHGSQPQGVGGGGESVNGINVHLDIEAVFVLCVSEVQLLLFFKPSTRSWIKGFASMQIQQKLTWFAYINKGNFNERKIM